MLHCSSCIEDLIEIHLRTTVRHVALPRGIDFALAHKACPSTVGMDSARPVTVAAVAGIVKARKSGHKSPTTQQQSRNNRKQGFNLLAAEGGRARTGKKRLVDFAKALGIKADYYNIRNDELIPLIEAAIPETLRTQINLITGTTDDHFV